MLSTRRLQALYLARRVNDAMPKIIAAADESSRDNVRHQFERVKNSPAGMYALIDYVNFKGEGLLLSERYNGQGWGLLQVLENMKGEQPGVEATAEFAVVAKELLALRVKNDPKDIPQRMAADLAASGR